MSNIPKAWCDYWFHPTRLVDLAIFRIAVVGTQLILFFPALRPQLSLLELPVALYTPLPALKLLLTPFGTWGMQPSAAMISIVWSIGLISGVLALLGILARVSLIAFALANTFLLAHLYSYGQLHHPEAVMIVALWALVLAPAGASMSVVRLRRRLRTAVAELNFVPHRALTAGAPNTSEFALWPLRLVQWFLCLIYLSAGISKLVNGGPAWLDASTMQYYLIGDGILRHANLGLFAASHPSILPILATFAIAFELSFVLVMFIPVLAWVYIPLGVLMHTGIFAMQHIRFFQFFVAYVAFAEMMRRTWPDVRNFLARITRRQQLSTPDDRWTLVYDGFCPLCTRTMVIVDALDITEQLGYIDFERDWGAVVARAPSVTIESAREAIHLVSPCGDVYRGYYGFKQLARRLPLMWPAVVVLAIPGMDWLGVRVYDEIASRRGRRCTAETCGVPVS